MELTYEQRYNELAQIVTNTTWSANERIMYATLRIQAHKRPSTNTKLGSYALFDDLTEDKAAELAGVSKGTAGDTLRKFKAVGLVERDKPDRETVNRYGIPIPRQSYNEGRGDRWQSAPPITAIPPMPTDLPELPEAPRAERARVSSKAYRNKLNELSDKLRQLECPDCHNVSDWGAVCGACGRIWTADELANVAEESFHCHQDAQNLPCDVSIGQNSGEVSTKPGDISESVTVQNTPSVTEPTEPAYSPLTITDLASDEPGAPLSAYSETPADLATDPCAEVFPLGNVTPLALDPLPDYRVVLQGAHTVRFFDELDASFCLVEGRGKKAINTRDDWGDELSWVDTPITGDAAERHLASGGNVGILTGRGQIGLIDIDNDLAGFLARYPLMATLPRITRDNAPDRAKLLVILADETIRSRTYKGSLHKLELLALGNQGVCAGVHESGAVIRFTIGDLVQLTFDQVDELARGWTGTTREITPTVKRALQSRPAGSLVRDACQHWNLNNQALVWSEFEQCPKAGKYRAVRADDRTPSTLPDSDPWTEVHGQTWFDYGTRRKFDALELHCELNGLNKSDFIFSEVLPAYKQATGR